MALLQPEGRAGPFRQVLASPVQAHFHTHSEHSMAGGAAWGRPRLPTTAGQALIMVLVGGKREG